MQRPTTNKQTQVLEVRTWIEREATAPSERENSFAAGLVALFAGCPQSQCWYSAPERGHYQNMRTSIALGKTPKKKKEGPEASAPC